MPELQTLTVFCIASVVMLVTPGPAVFYIVARSVDQGRTAGIVASFGMHGGTVVHVAAAAFGVSALLASSAEALTVLKYLGAAYLVYLGVRQLRQRTPSSSDPAHLPKRSLTVIFCESVLVNLFNPKTALFFLAFLPQFVDPSRGPVVAQILFLGVVFVFLGTLTDGAYALAAGTVRGRLLHNPVAARIQQYFSGTVLVGLGIGLAFAGGERTSVQSLE